MLNKSSSFLSKRILSMMLLTAVQVLMLGTAQALGGRPVFMGDPGSLTDHGVDLSTYELDSQQGVARSRGRRFLSFPPSSVAQLKTQLTVPLFEEYDAYVKGVFKGIFVISTTLPTNFVTLGKSLPAVEGRALAHHSPNIAEDRLRTYTALENAFDGVGVPGHQCLLKAICEASEEGVPEHYGLLGEIAAMLLTPSHNRNNSANAVLSQHAAAEEYGRGIGHCGLVYSGCPLHLPDLMETALTALHSDVQRGKWFW